MLILKIMFNPDNEVLGDIGTSYIQTSNQVFIEEVHKYKCPIRLGRYIDSALAAYEDVTELTDVPEHHDIFISLVDESLSINRQYIQKGVCVDEYLEITDSLDQYGETISED
ncbi:MAG: hypothetical protein COA44_02250 [Arcobacter sp.]|nr:MAG: hypothetical protein COA44_02250 [Arcobacter sp.]